MVTTALVLARFQCLPLAPLTGELPLLHFCAHVLCKRSAFLDGKCSPQKLSMYDNLCTLACDNVDIFTKHQGDRQDNIECMTN